MTATEKFFDSQGKERIIDTSETHTSETQCERTEFHRKIMIWSRFGMKW